jgi:predicted ester cyclase
VTNETPPDTTTDKPTEPSAATSVEGNKAVSRRWIEVFNERDDAGEADVRTQDYVAYAPVSLEPAPLDSEAWTRFLAGFVEAFPDLQLTVEDAVAEGDLVAQRVHFAGTHTGEFQGLPPTQRKVTFSGLELNRFRRRPSRGALVPNGLPHASSAARSRRRARPAVAAARPGPSVEEAAQETLIGERLEGPTSA